MTVRHFDAFTTISTEGTLLPPDLLKRIADGSGLSGLLAVDYHRDGERLTEVINRSWNVLQGAWANFQTARERRPAGDLGTSITRERWLLPLFRELDYGRLQPTTAETIDSKQYPISHRALDCTPIHLISYQVELDRSTPGVAGASRQSPHSLLQTYLNKQTDALWGFVSNGRKLRILRDNASLTRQAFVEVDLEVMMENEVYSDFVLFWLLCHESRVEGGRDCWLERWSKTAAQQGTRALDQLRDGVQHSIEALGTGFLEHPHNSRLRDQLRSGTLDKQDYFRQLLRIAYRLLFLFVAEDRDLLYDPEVPESIRAHYRDYYSTQRLRRIAEKVKGTQHTDHWESFRLVMRLLGGEASHHPRVLGIPVLGSFLFRDLAVSDLIEAQIDNTHFLDAIRALAFTEDRAVRALRPVDYHNLGSEEFGSVYESLLELIPYINVDARTFALAFTAGSDRKTTGSYYTPTALIEPLLKSALDPVIDQALAKPNPKSALLALAVCDPACGSGHFLVLAAHRIGKALAQLESGEEEPAPHYIQAAVREVIGHCIYGVDINPDAVELCKVALWLNAMEPGKSLSFLDHKIKCGNSLIGTTPELIAEGLPDEAFAALTGDDPKVTSQYKALNRKARKDRAKRQTTYFSLIDRNSVNRQIATAAEQIDELDNGSIDGQLAQEERHHRLLENPFYLHQRWIADAWTAAFLWDKRESGLYPILDTLFQGVDYVPQTPDISDLFDYPVQQSVAAIRNRNRFFHWHLEFPEVFEAGGFDCVLGNPPWDRIKIQEKEWFAIRNPDIASAPNAAARRRMIGDLVDSDPYLLEAFKADLRLAEGESHYIRVSGSFPLTGRGDVNTYALFAERNRQLISANGRVGCIVPSGVATDDTTKFFFQDLMDTGSLVSLYDFENREGLFEQVHRSTKFCLITARAPNNAATPAEFVFFALKPDHLLEKDRHFTLSAEDIRLINPNTRTCATFRSQRDAELTKAIYRRVPVLIREAEPEDVNPWGIKFTTMFHMSNDSHLFRTREQLESAGYTLQGNTFVPTTSEKAVYREEETFLPLYEAKMIHQFDHRWATYDGNTVRDVSDDEKRDPMRVVMPRYWVNERNVDAAIGSTPYMLGFRDVARSTDERTAIAGIIPRVAVGNKLPIIVLNRRAGQFSTLTSSDEYILRRNTVLYTNLTSFVFDYVVRQKLGGTTMNFFYVKQLPVLSLNTYNSEYLTYIVSRVLELTYTAWDLQPFARDLGYDGPPFAWDVERRFQLRCELDALYFHLYSIARDDVDYIMGTFPIVKRKDEAIYGVYRTKEEILRIYDILPIS